MSAKTKNNDLITKKNSTEIEYLKFVEVKFCKCMILIHYKIGKDIICLRKLKPYSLS